MTTRQKTWITATIAVAISTAILQKHQGSGLRDELHVLQQQRAALTRQSQQLQRERDENANRLSALADEMKRVKEASSELPALRAEVDRLRQASKEHAQLQQVDAQIEDAFSWKKRVKLLKQHLEQNPGVGIPELQLATENDWMDAARGELQTEKDYRRAMSGLRNAVERIFASELQIALDAYVEANQHRPPTDMSQLRSYFNEPVDEAMFQRYAIFPGEIPDLSAGRDWIQFTVLRHAAHPHFVFGSEWMISVKSPVDKEFDTRLAIGAHGFLGTTESGIRKDLDLPMNSGLEPVIKAYTATYGGREPSDPTDLLPYIKTPEQRAEYDQAMALRNSR